MSLRLDGDEWTYVHIKNMIYRCEVVGKVEERVRLDEMVVELKKKKVKDRRWMGEG